MPWDADFGLMSYGASLADAFRQAGVYGGSILKAARYAGKPPDGVRDHLSTANALCIEVPPARTLALRPSPHNGGGAQLAQSAVSFSGAKLD